MAKGKWSEFLILYRAERKQILAFIAVVCLLLVFKFSIPYWYTPQIPSLNQLEKHVVVEVKEKFSIAPTILVDVNTDNHSDWMQLGFSAKQAKVILKYKNAIGGFHNQFDLMKCYVVDSATYWKLEDHLFCSNPKQVVQVKQLEPLESKPIEKTTALKLIAFDANTVTAEELLAMGLAKGLAENWINYRNKVGPFDSIAEVKKLYSVDEELYAILRPHLHIRKQYLEYDLAKAIFLDLNTCDSFDLLELHGIGPYYTHLILAYRNRLGGFIDMDQLFEIKGIPEKTLESIRSSIRVNSNFEVRKLNLNSDEFHAFLKHPYFNFYNTKKIFQFKDRVGKFTSLHDLKKVGFVDTNYVSKISPYLTIE